MLAETPSMDDFEGVGKVLLGAQGSGHEESEAVVRWSTVLNFQDQRLLEFATRYASYPKYWTDQLSILREVVLTRQGSFYGDSADTDPFW